ncbi:Protein piwi [Orchesella cincta]|uniref:Protein piwi n=1 Tax=Orchesella cincta TaxID=48709 RepID=A0A1D2NCH7_ORCCI|nr:Protein piwi [Orchesella cincta]
MREHPEIKSELVNWGMELDGKLVELKGRILAKEVVSFAKGTHQVDDKRRLYNGRSDQMLTSVNLTTWVIIVPQRDFAGVDNLVRTMTKVAAPLSMAIGNPKQIIKVPDARSGSYLSAMEDALNLKPQMIFVILPNNKAELYNVVKKRLAVDKGECCHNFQEVNGELPERIIMYRDGVGEGQLKAVYNTELTILTEGLMKMYANGGRSPPLLTFIVVSKRVNTRLMMMKMNLQNPPPGTIVDEVVTLPGTNAVEYFGATWDPNFFVWFHLPPSTCCECGLTSVSSTLNFVQAFIFELVILKPKDNC